jgi:uncharacterized phage protein (TIGR02218 family)
MKIWLAGLLAHFQLPTTKLAMFWRVERQDALVFGWTDHDRDISISSLLYRASEGLQVSTVQTTDGFSVSTMDVTAFLDVSTEAEIQAGIWDQSLVTLFETRWDTPPATLTVDAVNILRHGVLGRIDRQNLRFTAEVRGLGSRLDTRIGRVVTITCPWRLGDSVCLVNLAPFTHTGTVTSVGVDPRSAFSASAQAQAAGYFNEGVITMTSGPNAGLGVLSTMDIRRWENREFLMHRPFPYSVGVGNTFSAVRGDDKLFATCRTVFGNVGKFGGMPYVPGIDKVLENTLLKRPLPPRPAAPDGNPDVDPNIIGNSSGE